MTFEQSIKRLDEIVEIMSKNDVPLEESLKLYEEGTLLVKKCKEQLSEAELKVEKLSQKGENDA